MADPIGGKVVLVTGASSGIGRALVELLAGRGVRVVAVARNAEPLRASASLHVTPFEADVRRDSSVTVLLERMRESGLEPDIVVNNAGVGMVKPFLESTSESWREIIDTNLLGALRVAHAVLPRMLERGRGLVVNVGSSAAEGWPYVTLYSASKAALDSATRSLDREYAGRGVRVIAVEIGPTHSTSFGARSSAGDIATAAGAWTKLGIAWGDPITPEQSAARIVAAIEQALVGR